MQLRTRIKVCGMTRPEDASAAAELGVDAIGLIFYSKSPRYVSLEQAKRVRDVLPPFVSVVGVFVDASASDVEHYTNELALDFVQLHGAETAEFASALSKPYIKALRAKNSEQVRASASQYGDASAFLLDPYVKGLHGGTGQVLGDDCWPSAGLDRPMLLAGGLGPDNIYQRVTQLKPFAVDINSGVEQAPGVKNIELIKRAIVEVNKADHAIYQSESLSTEVSGGDK